MSMVEANMNICNVRNMFSRFQNRLLFLTRRNPFVAEKPTEQKQAVSSSNRFILGLFITVFYLCCLTELFIISGRLCFFRRI